ncbi:MAG: transporter substrate-binding domain-containing protein, partial [Firmicutes bacterium]|nr:transporter substrate-binding domain-containing protein [Bacillota bacterium]
MLFSLCMAGCGGGDVEEAADTSLDDIKAKGQLILGLDDSFPPMGFKDENGNIVGFDIDVAKAVCEILGVELVLKPIDWKSKIGNSDMSTNFKTSYETLIQKGDYVIRE